MVLKTETFLISQNLTKDKKLLFVCSEVQKCGMVETYLGIVTPQIDTPDFFANFDQMFQKLSLIQGMAQKVYVCMWTNVQGLCHI